MEKVRKTKIMITHYSHTKYQHKISTSLALQSKKQFISLSQNYSHRRISLSIFFISFQAKLLSQEYPYSIQQSTKRMRAHFFYCQKEKNKRLQHPTAKYIGKKRRIRGYSIQLPKIDKCQFFLLAKERRIRGYCQRYVEDKYQLALLLFAKERRIRGYCQRYVEDKYQLALLLKKEKNKLALLLKKEKNKRLL